MKIMINNILYAIADALDYVEAELLGATTNHARRVAYISAEMGKRYGLNGKQLLNLAACAVLHDNALTEYEASELNKGLDILQNKSELDLKDHCIMGEKNLSLLPFYKDAKGTILYHHEEADGTGPMGLKTEEIPLYSKIIHIADIVDVAFDLSDMSYGKYKKAISFVEGSEGTRFDSESVNCFKEVCTYGMLCRMDNDYIAELLSRTLPEVPVDYTNEDLEGIAGMFARVTDYKSTFTCTHSAGVARKVKKLAISYGFDDNKVAKIYFAGALHDIGKLIISNDILEKPDKLTDDEFTNMKNHAYMTWEILGRMQGVGDIRYWAAYHHEKLDGSGYPFGLNAEGLSREARMMACVDIYQALTENRPYRKGMSHEKCIEIMRKEAERGKLDPQIVEDINKCFDRQMLVNIQTADMQQTVAAEQNSEQAV